MTASIEAKVVADLGGAPLPAPGTHSVEEFQPVGRLAEAFEPRYRGRTIMLMIFQFFQTFGFYGFAAWVPTLIAQQNGINLGASLLYLLQERRLKAKKSTSLISFLPALEVIDQIGYRSLLLGFPFMTLGLITGSIVALTTYGRMDFLDPKILLSLLMWAVYMLMVFTRWNSGWRGRRAAFLATFAFAAALAAWAANYFSTIHRFAAS